MSQRPSKSSGNQAVMAKWFGSKTVGMVWKLTHGRLIPRSVVGNHRNAFTLQ